MVWQLAEKYYNRAGLQEKLHNRCLFNKIHQNANDAALSVSEGSLDYAFVYKCVANRFGLKYITLPKEINLSSPAYSDYYRHASIEIEGEEPGTMSTINGTPIEFAIAVTNGSEQDETAKSFLELALSKEGQQILEDCGLIPY